MNEMTQTYTKPEMEVIEIETETENDMHKGAEGPAWGRVGRVCKQHRDKKARKMAPFFPRKGKKPLRPNGFSGLPVG